MWARLRWVLPLLLVFVAGHPQRCEGVAPSLRIGLAQDLQEIAFSGVGVEIVPLSGGEPVAVVEAGQTWRLVAEGGRLLLRGPAGAMAAEIPGGARLRPPEGGTVVLHGLTGHPDGRSDRAYRGLIEVRLRLGITVVNIVDLETYLRGVVPCEMRPSYPLAALQAQAVAARGQALAKAGRHADEGFDLCAGQHCQVYGGATSEHPESDRAVASTWGQVLVYQGRLANTLYAANCGGHTVDNEDYWPGQPAVPYLRGQPDFEPESGVRISFPMPEDKVREYLKYAPPVNCNQPGYAAAETIRWWRILSRDELEAALRAEAGDFGELLGVRVGERAPSGIVRRLDIIGSKRLVKVAGGEQIRRALGGARSASLALDPIPDRQGLPAAFVIWGAGWGHQVGMCQVGAAGLAARGWDYQRILSKYYPGCALERRY